MQKYQPKTDFKPGDEIVCIDDSNAQNHLTRSKIYRVVSNDGKTVIFTSNLGVQVSAELTRFDEPMVPVIQKGKLTLYVHKSDSNGRQAGAPLFAISKLLNLDPFKK